MAQLFRLAFPGLLGSVHVTFAAWGLGYLPLQVNSTFASALRSTPASHVLTKLALIVGVALMLHSWLALRQCIESLSVSDLRFIALMWCSPLLLAPPVFSRDLYSYFAQGRLVNNGWNPYVIGVGALDGWFSDGADPVWARTPSPYGALFLLIEQGVFRLSGGSPLVAVTLFRLLSIGALIALTFVLPVLSRLMGTHSVHVLWLALLNPMMIIDTALAGHNDPLMVLAIGLGFVLVGRSLVLAAATIGLAAAIKPVALLALPFIALARLEAHSTLRHRLGLWFVSCAVGVGTLVLLIEASGFGWGWIRALAAPTQTHTLLSISTLLGLVVDQVMYFRLGGIVVGFVCVLYLLSRKDAAPAVRSLGLAFLVVVVCSPAVHSWYLMWFIPLLAVAGLSRPAETAALALVIVVTTVVVASQVATSDTFIDVTDIVALTTAAVASLVAALPYRRVLSKSA